MSFFILFVKGLLVGMGKIIPGVSGAVIALSLGIYEKGLKAISNLFKNIVENIKFLFPIGCGVLISILFLSKIIVNALNIYYLPTMLLFCGLIIGSMSKENNDIKWNKKNIIIFTTILILTLLLSFIKNDNDADNNFMMLILMGIIEAISMIVPGLSGTALLMSLGYYNLIMVSYSTMNLKILFPFSIGIIVGIIVLSKIISYLFDNYPEKTKLIVYAFSISSIIILLLDTFKNNYSIKEVVISLFLLIIGYIISKNMEKIK